MAQQENTASPPELQLSYTDDEQYRNTLPSKMRLRMATPAGRQALANDSFQ